MAKLPHHINHSILCVVQDKFPTQIGPHTNSQSFSKAAITVNHLTVQKHSRQHVSQGLSANTTLETFWVAVHWGVTDSYLDVAINGLVTE